ncbi:MAG: hypothetical protein QOC71_1286 [Thermoplasmata archaeon]|jgi:hypothetical protein|nr:hypothetical protein [Thermoplasmata archaeon]
MHKLVVFTLLLASLVAGCFGGGEHEATPQPVGAALPDAATVAVYHRAPTIEHPEVRAVIPAVADTALVPVGAARYLPVSTFEPSLGSDPDGCLFMTNFHGTGTGTRIYMSCDQAATWAEIGPSLGVGTTPCFPNSNDPFVHVDRDTGRVFASDLHALVSSTLHYTDDKGATWQCNPGGGGTPPGAHDHQSISTGTPRMLQTVGYPNIVYYCINRVADTACSSSLDGGIGFGPLVTVYPGIESPGEGQPPTLCGGLSGHGETDHAGRLLVPKGQCGHPEVAVSENDGLTFSRAIVSSETGVMGHEVRVVADAADNLYAFYIGTDGLPYLGRSTDHGQSWDQPWMVAPPGVTAASFPAVSAGADGKVAVAYIGITDPEGYDADPEDMAWNAYVTATDDALAADPLFATVQANQPGDPIARGVCGNSRCGGLGDFIDMTVDPEGRPWAAFADMCRADCLKADATENDGGTVGFVGTFLQGYSLATGQPLPRLAELPVPEPAT